MLNKKVIDLIKEHGIDLKNENVVIAGPDGFIDIELENGTLKINVQFTDRVIKTDESIESFIE